MLFEFSSSKNREIIVWRSCPSSQSIGRGRISREVGGSPWSSHKSRTAWQNFRRKDRKRHNFQKEIGSGKQFEFSVGNFHFFGREKTNFLGGGIISKLARQWPSWGIYKHAPPVFWRKMKRHFHLLYWKTGGQIKTAFSWGGQLQLVNLH